MANIQKRVGKLQTSYKASIRLKGHPCRRKTFPTRDAAEKWANETEWTMRGGHLEEPDHPEEYTHLPNYPDEIMANIKFFTKREVLDLCKCGDKFLDNEIRQGHINAYQPGREALIDSLSLNKWVMNFKTSSG